MRNEPDPKIIGGTPEAISRRNFIKGVIGGGMAVSATGYLFRASILVGQSSSAPISASGLSGDRLITINVNGQQRRADCELDGIADSPQRRAELAEALREQAP